MKKTTRESQELGASKERDLSRFSSTRWFVPLSRNRFFTGREGDLRFLYENFHLPDDNTQARVQVISGAGGIGKTQLALEYAHRFRDNYAAVIWLHAQTTEILLADLTALMDFLNLPLKQGRGEHHQILSAIKRWLNEQVSCLLILDNVENFDVVRELLPTRTENHLLLTTRQQGNFISEYHLHLQIWSTEEGTLFLLHRAKLLPMTSHLDSVTDELRLQATAICEELGELPLALDQAGAYLEETGCTLAGYQQRMQERQVLLLSRRGPESFAHPDPVTATILLAVERVEQQVPAAAELLRLFAFLAPDAIPEELITGQCAETLGPVLYPSVTNPFEIDTIYATFNATSLVKLDVHSRLLAVHRLVQTVLLNDMNKDTQQQWAQRALLAVNRVFPVICAGVSPASLSKSGQLLPHALLTLMWIDRFLSEEQQSAIAPQISDLSLKVGNYLFLRGYLQKAQPHLECSLSLREHTAGPMDPLVAEPLARLGYLLRLQGSYAGAEALLQRALTIYEHASPAQSADLVRILSNLAMVAVDRGLYQQAETYMKRLISIQEQLQLVEGQLPSLMDLATIYSKQGRYEEARALLLHDVRLREQACAPQDPGLLAALNNLASFYWKQDRYAEAMPLYQRALHLIEQMEEPDDSHIAIILFNLGEVSRKQEHFEESESYYLRALSLWEQTMGAGHLQTAYALHGLALLRMAQGQYREAEQFLRDTIQIRVQAYDDGHPDLADALHDLALLYSMQGNDEAAQSLFEQTLHIREQFLDSVDPAIATSLHQLGLLYVRQGRKEKAQSYFQRSLVLREQALGKWHSETQQTRSCLEALQDTSDNTSPQRSLGEEPL